jgi:hypothetical protein
MKYVELETGALRWSILEPCSATTDIKEKSLKTLLVRTCAVLSSARPGDLNPSFTLELATPCTTSNVTTQKFLGSFRPNELPAFLKTGADVAVSLLITGRVGDDNEVSGVDTSVIHRHVNVFPL